MPDAPPDPPAAPGRRWIPLLLGYAALLLLPAILGLVLLGSRFQALSVPLAMEHAQIARNVAAGRGLSTDSIRPLSLAVQPKAAGHPDLYHAPAHPLLLGLVFRLTRPSDRVSAALGLGLWFLTVLLTFFLARRLFDARVAALATLLYGCNASMLKAALSGLPHPLLALLVLFAAGLLALPRHTVEPGGESRRDLAMVGAGLFAALAAMGHYLLFFLAPCLLVPLVLSRRRRGRAVVLFAAGFGLILLPWVIRNLRLSGAPLFSLYWYEALSGTAAFPGDALWRSFAAAPLGPLDFLVTHPIQSSRKILSGLLRFWQEGPAIVDPLVGVLCLAALGSRKLGAPERGWLASPAIGALCCSGAACLFRPEPEILLAWTPVLCIGAAAFVSAWLRERLPEVSLREAWKIPPLRWVFRQPDRARAALGFALPLGVVLLAALPLSHYLWVFRPEPSSAPREADLIRKQVPEGFTVLTDQPAFMAWHGGRRAVWICFQERDWDALESHGVSIDATYVGPAISALFPGGNAGWLWWIVSPRGVYRGLHPVEPMPPRAVLRVRRRGPP